MIVLIFNSILLGFGLAMDAFSVSVANGLNEPHMKSSRMFLISGTFAAFQCAMPLIGWVAVKTIGTYFSVFYLAVPYIALVLLGIIGTKMIVDGVKADSSSDEKKAVGKGNLVIQGIATSIDALSVGFTTASYNFTDAIISSLIIGVVTLIICLFGVLIGKKIGNKFSGKASVAGGIILILIGIEIFITGILK